MPADSELVQAIAVLARAHQDAVWRRTAPARSCARCWRDYYPAFLAAFAGKTTNLASREARAVLAITPTPADTARLTVARVAAALRRAGRHLGIDGLAAKLHTALRTPQLRQPRWSNGPWACRPWRCWPP